MTGLPMRPRNVICAYILEARAIALGIGIPPLFRTLRKAGSGNLEEEEEEDIDIGDLRLLRIKLPKDAIISISCMTHSIQIHIVQSYWMNQLH